MKKFISIIMAIMFVFSVMPLNAYAAPASVKAIEYTPDDPIVCYYETDGDGSWQPDGDGNQYFYYYCITKGTGDVLTVIDNDDNRTDYVATYDDAKDSWYFISADGDIINDSDVEMTDDQINNHFTVGTNNYFTVSYSGKTCQVPVEVRVNPVKSIEFIPAKEKFVVENMGGEWRTDDEGNQFYSYYPPSYENGDVLKVTAGDGTVTVYTYREVNYNDSFYDENDNELPDSNELYNSKYSNDKWLKNTDNYYFVVYKQHSVTVKVVVIECNNPAGHIWDDGVETKPATYTAAGIKTCTCKYCGQTKTETIPKLPKEKNPIVVKAKSLSLKFKLLKKKNIAVARKNAISISKAKGKLTFKKVKGNAKISVNKKTGKITVKKGLKKGTYNVKIKVSAAGNEQYNAASKTVTVKIVVK